MGAKFRPSQFTFAGRPNSVARKTWERLVQNEEFDSSTDREELRALVLRLGVSSPLGREINQKFNLAVR